MGRAQPGRVRSIATSQIGQTVAGLWRHKWQIFLVTAVVVAVAASTSLTQNPQYIAQARVLVRSLPGIAGANESSIDLETEAQILASQPVASLVADELGYTEDTTTLLDALTVSTLRGTDVLVVTYSATEPRTARDLANSFANNYLTFRGEETLEGVSGLRRAVQQRADKVESDLRNLNTDIAQAARRGATDRVAALEAERSVLVARLAVLQQGIERLNPASLASRGAGEIIQEAVVPERPFSPNHTRNGMLGLMGGLAAATLIALLREKLDDRLRTPFDLQRVATVPVLGTIPRFRHTGRDESKLIVAGQPGDPASEAYGNLRANIQFIAADTATKSFLVTSPSGNEGKTVTAVNLAIALAQSGASVILVSADLRRPTLDRYLRLAQGRPGLGEWLLGKTPDPWEVVHASGIPNLRIVPGGEVPQNGSELFSSPRLRHLLTALAGRADYLLVDGPPAAGGAEAGVLASLVDETILVAHAAHSRRSDVAQARITLERFGGRTVGTVLNAGRRGTEYEYLGRPDAQWPTTRGRSAREHAQRVGRVAVATAFAFVLMIAGDALYVAIRIADVMPAAAGGFARARQALAEGDLEQARGHIGEAAASANAALALSRHPAIVLGAQIPSLGRDALALRGLAQATSLSSLAATEAFDAIETTGLLSDEILVYGDGRVSLDVVKVAAASVAAETLLRTAHAVLQDVPDRLTFPRIQDAVIEAGTEIEDARGAAERARSLLGALPSLLGENERKRYFLAFQTPGEARGTGGLLGLYGILEAQGGKIDLVRVDSANGLRDLATPVDAPPEFEANYGRFALTEWRQANSSPNFPVVAEVWLDMYEETRGERLDGVVAMDPLALEKLLVATGPVEAPSGEVVDARNVAKTLMHDSYLEFPDDRTQSRFLAAIVRAFWRKVETGDLDARAAIAGLADSSAARHFQLAVRDDEVADAFADLGLDGSISGFGPHIQMLFNNNYSANKVDYYLARSSQTVIELERSGAAWVSTSITLRNDAPSGPPSVLLGGDNPGVNRMVLSLVLPRTAVVEWTSINQRRTVPNLYQDAGFPVAWDTLTIQPGASGTMTVTYRVPDAVDLSSDLSRLSFVLLPQATTHPDHYSVSVTPPSGMRISSAPQSESADANRVTYSGTLRSPVSIVVTVAGERRSGTALNGDSAPR